MKVKLSMYIEINKNSFEELKRITENHIEYLLDLDSFPEIETVYNVRLNCKEKDK